MTRSMIVLCILIRLFVVQAYLALIDHARASKS